MRGHRMRLLTALALVALALAACSETGSPSPPVGDGIRSTPAPDPSPSERSAPLRLKRLRIALEPVVTGLEAPLFVTHSGGRALYVVEQVGRIRIVRRGRLLARPFLDISERVTAGGEQGLLGLAFHPGYGTNGRLFVNYTDLDGDTVVSEFSRAGGGRADPASERVLLRIDQPYSNHNGGAVIFGPDGYLYIGTGDGGSAGDPEGNGQRLDTLLGKLLRIDVDRQDPNEPYGIPADNPFVSRSGARPEIWAYGLRNPWRFSFDRTGIWIGDVGQGAWEEIDRMPVDEAGANYGWNVMEGESCYEPPRGCRAEGLVMPIATYSHDHGCSVTGGYVYRGSRFPQMVGAYLFGDYCSGLVWGLRAAGGAPQAPVLLLESGRSISSFGVNRRGEMFVTDLASGELLRVTAR